eukprot:scaffold51874_cov63-Phaeocystis_antarctica.AAC.2
MGAERSRRTSAPGRLVTLPLRTKTTASAAPAASAASTAPAALLESAAPTLGAAAPPALLALRTRSVETPPSAGPQTYSRELMRLRSARVLSGMPPEPAGAS